MMSNHIRPTLPTIPPGLAALANGRDVITTREAARIVNRAAQTLREWSCLGNGPIRPIRINGRLAWRVVDLAAVLRGETPAERG